MTDIDREIDRAEVRDPVVRAWTCRLAAFAIRAAVEAAPDGPLKGWSLGVKDVIDTAGLPTRRGSPIFADRATTNDAACVALARAAGATVVGKTATTEFALIHPAPTTNPHNAAHTPGGSSSGSAAAVADGQVRAAFGTQTVGSVLRPAAYCGVVGFKPTHQLVPLTGVATLAHSFDTVGWFTTDVADSESMLEAMTCRGPEPSGTRPVHERPLRIGHYPSHQAGSAESGTIEILHTVAERLAASGVEVVHVDPLPHLASVFEDANIVLSFEIRRVFAWEREHHWEQISPLVQKMLQRADRVQHDDFVAAQHRLTSARFEHGRFMDEGRFDALLTPSAPGEAPPIATTGDSVFNRTWTALWVPAIHLPTGTGPAGLPVGIQLAGSRWADDELLRAARQVETLMESSS